MPQVEFGQFKSDKFDMKFNYELWVPEGLEVKFYTIGKMAKKWNRQNNFSVSFKTPNFMITHCWLKSMVAQAVIK